MELNLFLLFAPHKKWELHTFSLYTHYEFNKFLWLPLLWGQMVQWWINEMMNRCSDFCVRIIAWVQSVVYTFINIFWVVCDRKAPFFTSKKTRNISRTCECRRMKGQMNQSSISFHCDQSWLINSMGELKERTYWRFQQKEIEFFSVQIPRITAPEIGLIVKQNPSLLSSLSPPPLFFWGPIQNMPFSQTQEVLSTNNTFPVYASDKKKRMTNGIRCVSAIVSDKKSFEHLMTDDLLVIYILEENEQNRRAYHQGVMCSMEQTLLKIQSNEFLRICFHFVYFVWFAPYQAMIFSSVFFRCSNDCEKWNELMPLRM